MVALLGPRAPPSPAWGSLAAAARAATTPEQVRVAWHGVLHEVEQELAAVHGFDGAERELHCGRAAGARFRLVPEAGRVRGADGHVSRDVSLLRRAVNLGRVILCKVAAQGRAPSQLNASSLDACVHKFRRKYVGAVVRTFGLFALLQWRLLDGAGHGQGAHLKTGAALTSHFFSVGVFSDLLQGMTVRADREARSQRDAAATGWKIWARAAVTGGAARGHGWVPAAQAQAAIDSAPGGFPARGLESLHEGRQALGVPLFGLQPSVDRTATEWSAVWGPTDSPLTVGPASGLPGVTGDQVLSAARAFPARAAPGLDGFRPRSWEQLSGPAATAIADVLSSIERVGSWPVDAPACMVALPKPDGGHRLIALLGTLYRVWGRVRRQLVSDWMQSRVLRGHFGVRGKSAEQSLWQQGFERELAETNGEEWVSLLVDITKAFDNIRRADLAEAFSSTGFPAGMVAPILSVYGHPRCVRSGRACSESARFAGGVLAGCPFGPAGMHAVLHSLVTTLEARSIGMGRVFVLADDITLFWRGRLLEAALIWRFTRLVTFLVVNLQERHIPVSARKSGLVASSRAVAVQAERRLVAFTLGRWRWMRNLGGDISGHSRLRAIQGQRVALQRGRLRRLQALRRVVGRRVRTLVSAGATAAIRYAASSQGVAPTLLKRQRTLVSAAVGHPPRA